MKTFEFDYPWTQIESWYLPDDEEMMKGQFPILDEQIDTVLNVISQQGPGPLRTCIQAGGAFGMYPMRLSYYFGKVFTFEPVAANLACLLKNLSRVDSNMDNVVVCPYALWDGDAEELWMTYSKPVKNSYGAHHVSTLRRSGEGACRSITVDLYGLDDVDLIWLDIEGFESYALRGATETIARCRPVVVLEERSLPHMAPLGLTAAHAGKWLRQNHDYRYAGKTHGDSIFVPQ